MYCVTFQMQHAEFPQKGQHLTKDTASVSHYLWHPQLVPEGVITQTNCSNHLYHLKMCHLPVNCVRFLFGLWSSRVLQHMGSPACLQLSFLPTWKSGDAPQCLTGLGHWSKLVSLLRNPGATLIYINWECCIRIVDYDHLSLQELYDLLWQTLTFT